MEENWSTLETLKGKDLLGINFISVDTRDFFYLPASAPPEEQIKKKEIHNALKNHHPKCAFIPQDKIYGFLSECFNTAVDYINEHNGGYDDWMCFQANLDGCRNWLLKYIRLVRYNDNEFVVCNNDMQPVEWRKIVENIDFKYL